jgi:hypothetical protein
MDSAEPMDCQIADVLDDGRVVVRIAGEDRTTTLNGVVVPSEVRQAVIDMLQRLDAAMRPPLRCVVDPPADESSLPRVRISYLAWRDKSGDVWEDLATSLLDRGLARVDDGAFPEREDYLALEGRARARRIGLWGDAT